LDGVAAGLRHLPAARPPRLPRLADFARWGSAVETGLGWEAGSFPAACRKNRGEANGVALEAFPLAEPILALVEAEGEWAGLCKELLARLTERAGASPRAREGMAGDAGRAVARAAAGGAAPAGGRRGGDVPGAHPIGTAGAPVAVRARGPGGAGGP
jgi:hypothetical protein